MTTTTTAITPLHIHTPRPTLKIQLFSDLHIEHQHFQYPKPIEGVYHLFLAGDIGKIHLQSYKSFITYCASNWTNVWMVLGNHEYYHNRKDMPTLLKEYRTFVSKFKNVMLLEQEAEMIEITGEDGGVYTVAIIGTTFWSFIDPKQIDRNNCPVNCISSMKVKDDRHYTTKIGIERYNQIHLASREWFICTMNRLCGKDMDLDSHQRPSKIICLTHYPLTHDNVFSDKYKDEDETTHNIFATDMTDEFTKWGAEEYSDIICLSGHSHNNHDFVKNGVRYISNQLGYIGTADTSIESFRLDGYFEI